MKAKPQFLITSFTVIQALVFLVVVGRPEYVRAAAHGASSDYFCTLDHRTNCIQSDTPTIESDAKLPSFNLSITARNDLPSDDCVVASLNFAIDGQLVYTSPSLIPGTSVKNIDLGTFAPGKHQLSITEASYSAELCSDPANNGHRYQYHFAIQVYSSTSQPVTSFSVTGSNAVKVGDRISYVGDGWSPKGKPIKVTLGGKLVKRFPASKKFRGGFRLEDFKNRSTTECTDTLRATQGAVSKTVNLFGQPDKYIYYANGIERLDGKPLKAGTILCKGKEPKKKRKHAWVWKESLADSTSGFGLHIDDTIAGIQARNVFFGPSGAILLARDKGHDVIITANPTIGPIPRPDVAQYDPIINNPDLTGIIVINEPPCNPDFHTEGFTLRADHDLVINCPVNMEGGGLFVRGNLTVNSTLRGKGIVIATGSLTVKSLEDVAGRSLDSPASGSLIAGGQLLLGH